MHYTGCEKTGGLSYGSPSVENARVDGDSVCASILVCDVCGSCFAPARTAQYTLKEQEPVLLKHAGHQQYLDASAERKNQTGAVADVDINIAVTCACGDLTLTVKDTYVFPFHPGAKK